MEKSYKPEDFKRGVLFVADDEDSLIAALRAIPGYRLVELSPDQNLNLRFILISPSGAEIHLIHKKGTPIAHTTNILGPAGTYGQDHIPEGVPFADDEATKLADVAECITGLWVYRDISNADVDLLRQFSR